MRTTVITLILFILVSTLLHATHNRAGEITYKQIGPSTIEATITTYTQATSVAADRDSLQLCWGDGHCEILLRSNGNGEPIENDYKINHYTGTHTYTALDTYTLSMTDPNRNDGVLNVNPPNSVAVEFYIQTTFKLQDLSNQTTNQSPTLLIAPIDVGFVRQPFMHTPNAVDLDGDSIAYELVPPYREMNEAVPNYIPIEQIGAGPENSYTFDEQTGLLVWNSPQIVGQYNIAIKIKSYRNGVLNEEIIRDMQILIKPEENTPPEIQTNPEHDALITIKAGKAVEFDFSVDDSEDTPAEGEVFFRVSSAETIRENTTVDWYPLFDVLSGRFTWTPSINDIRTMPYQIVFKATDSQGFATFKVFQVQVVENSTSIPLTFQQLGFQLYPNPATSQTQLILPDNQINQSATISIFDNLGRLVQQQQIDKTNSSHTLAIGDLQVGQYSVRFQTETTNVSTLLIIL